MNINNIERLGAPIEFKFAAGAAAGALDGYGAIFGNVDAHGDIIAPGAFGKSIAEHNGSGNSVPMFWSHDPADAIGKWDNLSEDANGLHVTGALSLGNSKARDVHALIKDGAVRGLSIGYRVREAEPTKSGNRLLKEIEVVEVSVVALPANSRARIISVKSALTDDHAMTERICEDALREAGVSRALAKAIVSTGIKAALRQRDAADDVDLGPLIEALKSGALAIRNTTTGQ